MNKYIKKTKQVKQILSTVKAKDEDEWRKIGSYIKGLGEEVDGANIFSEWKGGGLFTDWRGAGVVKTSRTFVEMKPASYEDSYKFIFGAWNEHNIFALFPTYNTTQTTNLISWNEVIQMASSPPSLVKDRTPCLVPQLSGKKNKQAVIEHNQMTALIIDIDERAPTIDEVKGKLTSLLGGSAALIYSTSSAHRLKKGVIQGDRWRVLIPLKTAVSCHRWLDMQNALVFAFGGDKAAARIAQVAYAPNNPDNEFYKHEAIQGEPLDPNQLPPLFTELLDRLKGLEAEKIAEKQALTAKTLASRPINNSGGFSIASVNEAYDTAQVLKSKGYIRVGKKYISPSSQSGKAGVILFDDGRWFSHHGSDVDIGLKCDGGVCGDAFDLICYYDHGSDTVKTLASLAGQLDSEGQKQRQREYMQAKQAKQPPMPPQPPMNNQEGTTPSVVQEEVIMSQGDVASYMADLFSDVELTAAAVKEMKETKFLIDDVIVRGHFQVFAAPANGGKSALFRYFCEQLVKQDMQVLYVNVDAGASDLMKHYRHATKHGYKVLAPDARVGMSVDDIRGKLEVINKAGIPLNDYVFIIDTLKKFCDVISKSNSKDLYKLFRQLTVKGATICCLGHCNKYTDENDQHIYEGTADLRNDVDELIYFDSVLDEGTNILEVTTRPDKVRADFKPISFTIDKNNQLEVKPCDSAIKIISSKDKEMIESIKEAINRGITTQTAIGEVLAGDFKLSTKAARKKLIDFTEWDDPIIKSEKTGVRNELKYRIINGK